MAGRAAQLSLAEEILEFGEHLTVGHGDLVGQPFRWMPFWADFILDAFPDDWHVQIANLSVGRGGGKTAGCGMLALAALIGPLYRPGGLVVSASRSQDQAAFIYRYALLTAYASGFSRDRLRFTDSYKRIVYTPDPSQPYLNSEYRALSADGKTNLGRRPWLVFHDELGSVEGPTDPLYDALSTGATLERCMEVNISTQAEDDAALFSQLLDAGLSGEDPTIVSHLHAMDPETDDWLDPATWRKANPGLGISISEETFRGKVNRAKGMPARASAFKHFNLNARIAAGDVWISTDAWRACSGNVSLSWLRERPVWFGLDLASRTDLVALVILAGDPEERLELHPYFWTPQHDLQARSTGNLDLAGWVADDYVRAMPGKSIGFRQLAREVDRILSPLDVQFGLYDRTKFDQLAAYLAEIDSNLVEDLDADDALMRPCGQGFIGIGPGVDAAEHLVAEQIVVHGDNPAMNANIFGAKVVPDPADNRKIHKKKSSFKVDGAVAFAMAAKAACFEVEAEELFSDVLVMQ